MAGERVPGDADDPYNLNRFVEAQQGDYSQALAEIRSGRKQSHWMWYVFPSSMAWDKAPCRGDTRSRAYRRRRPT